MRGTIHVRRWSQLPCLAAAWWTTVLFQDLFLTTGASLSAEAWSSQQLVVLPPSYSTHFGRRSRERLHRTFPLHGSSHNVASACESDKSYRNGEPHDPPDKHGDTESTWMRHGLLFSSFTDGVLANPSAHEFWRRGLVRAMLLQKQRDMEIAVKQSAAFSPCSGPNVTAIDRLEAVDDALRRLDSDPDPLQLLLGVLDGSDTPRLRFVYVPTALYAVRLDSTNTPGKQRQRARADAKQRRDAIVQLLQSSQLLGTLIPVDVVTLDWEDGSVKHAMGPNPPGTGREAMTSWRPHLVYVQGGNTFWLHHCMELGCWREPLLDLLRDGSAFYCGSSAGAILAGASMEPACWKEWDDCRIVPGRGRYADWDGVDGMSLVGSASFFPHMTENWQAVVDRQSRGRNIVCLSDGDACLVDGAARTLTLASSPMVRQPDPVPR